MSLSPWSHHYSSTLYHLHKCTRSVGPAEACTVCPGTRPKGSRVSICLAREWLSQNCATSTVTYPGVFDGRHRHGLLLESRRQSRLHTDLFPAGYLVWMQDFANGAPAIENRKHAHDVDLGMEQPSSSATDPDTTSTRQVVYAIAGLTRRRCSWPSLPRWRS